MGGETMSENPEERPTEEPTERPTEPSKEEPTEKKEWYCIEHGPVVPREVHGRSFCPTCNKLLSKTPYDRGEEVEEGEGEAEEDVVTPPEVETIEAARILIRGRLKQVYGVGKGLNVVMRSLYDDPSPMRDPLVLHSWIKSLAPKANDQQLSVMVIKPLFSQFPTLPQAIDKYVASMHPPQQPPAYWGWPMTGQPYQHLYPAPPGGAPSYPTGSGYTYPGYPYSYPPSQPYPPWPGSQPGKPPKTYKVVVDGQEIETDESGFRAWTKYLDDRKKEEAEEERQKEAHELKTKKLEEEIKGIGKEEHLVKVKVGEEEQEVPASIAHLYLGGGDSEEVKALREKLDEEREERHKGDIKRLEDKIEGRPTLSDQIEYVRSMAPYFGYHEGARSTLDVLDSIRGDVQLTAQQILNKMPSPGGGFSPDVKRTPGERRRKAEEIQKGLRKSEEILEAEDSLIRASAKVT